MFYAIGLGMNVVFWLALWLIVRYRIGKWNDGLAVRASGLPPVGTRIAVEEAGLVVGTKTFPWPSLRIDQVELRKFGQRYRNVYFLERLSLATAEEVVVLDAAMMDKGMLLIGNVWHRLRGA